MISWLIILSFNRNRGCSLCCLCPAAPQGKRTGLDRQGCNSAPPNTRLTLWGGCGQGVDGSGGGNYSPCFELALQCLLGTGEERFCKHEEVRPGACDEVVSSCSLSCGYFEVLVFHSIIIMVQLALL